MESTAFHEAGHAWAYCQLGMPLRYVTIRPRRAEIVGICRPWKPRRISLGRLALVASAGPVTQAHHEMGRAPAAHALDFGDYVSGACLAGGDDDLRQSQGMLDSPESMGGLRTMISKDWGAVETLAGRLMSAGTVSGREAFEVLRNG